MICLFESRCCFLPRPGSLVEAGIHPQPGKTRGQGCRVQAAGTLVVFSAGTFVCWPSAFRASFWLICSRVRVRFGVRRCMTNEWNCDLQVVLQTTKCFTPTTDSTTMMDMLGDINVNIDIYCRFSLMPWPHRFLPFLTQHFRHNDT